MENIYLEDVTCKDTEYLVGLDMDILYQWRELVPTYEERLTRIEGIHVKDIRCGSADFDYELCGDERLPPNEFVRKIKLRNSAHLLLTGEHNVSEAASMTGFNNMAHFRDFFKKEYGIPPSEYQKRYRQG